LLRLSYRYARLQRDRWNITVGNFYEQFGSGLIFRSYEERGLGLDNAMDGVRIITDLGHGLTVKGVLGRQRLYFGKGEGIVRGLDGEWSLNQVLPILSEKQVYATVGASFVSKFQKSFDPVLNLPNNVGAWASRANLTYKGFAWNTEYAYKINDPSYDNGYIYLVPLTVAYLAWLRRSRFGFVRHRPSLMGVLIALVGGALAWWGAETDTRVAAHLGAVLGLVAVPVSVYGFEVVRRFQRAFLAMLFLIPVPG